MFLSTVGKYTALGWEMTKLSVLSAMEYRTSFLIQVIGMAVNNTAFLILWYIFFKRFPMINGWTFQDTVLLEALVAVNFSLVMIFGRGAFELARGITKGELDYFLSFPKSVLWHVAVSKTEISAIGDLLSGILFYTFLANPTPEKTLLFVFFSVVTALIFLSFIVITQSIAFFVGNFEEAAETFFHALLGIVLYPQSVFSGTLKFLMLTIIPAFFMATLPVQLIQKFDIKLSLMIAGYAVLSIIVATLVFNKGLKRYESGNLINTRL